MGLSIEVFAHFGNRLLPRAAFSLLLTAYCIFVSHCSKPVDPPAPPSGPDTTSHDFVWQIDTLGEGNASVLHDVAIIDENNIIAVGEFYLKDSTGQIDPTAYGIAKWNGSLWELKRLRYGEDSLLLNSIRGISIVNASDIWLAAGSIYHWDGMSPTAELRFSRLSLPDANATVEKIWASSGSSVYGVGNAGTIVSYDGSTWSRVESGTTTNINDVWGISSTEEHMAFVTVTSRYQAGDMKVLTITTTTVTDTNNWNTGRKVHGIWVDKNKRLYVCGGGIWRKADTGWTLLKETAYFMTRIRGTAWNDYFSVGAFGIAVHFNGSGFREYPELALDAGSWEALAVGPDRVVMAGYVRDRGIVAIGRR